MKVRVLYFDKKFVLNPYSYEDYLKSFNDINATVYTNYFSNKNEHI